MLVIETADSSLDVRRLRGILAERRITRNEFAAACGLTRAYVSSILSGSSRPGELAEIKMLRGVARLGLNGDQEADSAGQA